MCPCNYRGNCLCSECRVLKQNDCDGTPFKMCPCNYRGNCLCSECRVLKQNDCDGTVQCMHIDNEDTIKVRRWKKRKCAALLLTKWRLYKMMLPFQMKLFLAYCYFLSIHFLLAVHSWIDNFTFYGHLEYRDSNMTWLPNISSLVDSLVCTLDKL